MHACIFCVFKFSHYEMQYDVLANPQRPEFKSLIHCLTVAWPWQPALSF